MRSELRVVWATMRRDARLLARYPINTVGLVVLPLYQLLLPSLLLGSAFLVGGHAVGLEKSAGTADLAGFVFVGAFASSFTFGVFWGTAWTMTSEIETGTLEASWLTPSRRETFVLGNVLVSLLLSLASGLILFGLGGFVFGAHYLASMVYAMPALLISLASLVGIGYLLSATVLLLKEASFLIDTSSFVVIVLTGVMFPVTVLPVALQTVAYALPMTYALDLLRVHTLGTRALLPEGLEYALLIVMGLVFLPLGRWIFLRTERRLRVRGTLGLH